MARRDLRNLHSPNLLVGGSNASGVYQILPFSRPATRSFVRADRATSLATGFLPRAMMNSSPRAAFRRSFERFVFAWWTVYIIS